MSVFLFLTPAAQSEFTVSVEQEVYQAEENSNITMAWIFPVDTNKSPDLYVDLQNVKLKSSIYTYNSKRDAKLYLHEIYRDRLHCDPQLAMKGQFKCLLTDLMVSDTGTYQCIVTLNGKSNSKPCDLNKKVKRTKTKLIV
uniref:Immunoglobulin V-set domain-containing protein n=1 Tax=Amphilophus citrinellus TaxID=61819 RepID=A0A3Q0S0H8_AMPCI